MRAIVTFLLLIVAFSTTAASNNQLFILDASGSMWGRVGDKPKITVAQDVMVELVNELPAESKTGLLAYGHRRKGDCTDIESLVGLGPLEREVMIQRLQSLNPKGKTPITAAVKQAIRELRRLEESASVVLISDGLESCGGDPCEAVKAARKTGVEFRLHVVGFDLGEADAAQLKCMVEAGDGRYYDASNADELTGALKEAVGVQPGLLLSVTSNGKPTPANVRIRPSGTQDDGQTSRLGDGSDEGRANPRRIALEPGTYDVVVRPSELDAAPERRLTGIEIPKEGEVERAVDFTDGRLVIKAMANGEATPVDLTISKVNADGPVLSRHDYRQPEAFRLPPADYDIEVEPRELAMPAQRLSGVTVAAGEEVTQKIDFSPATVVLGTRHNGEPTPALYDVYESGTDEEVAGGELGGGPEDNHPNPERIELKPGDYDIAVNPRELAMDERRVSGLTLSAGEEVTKRVDFSPGTLVIGASRNEDPTPALYDVYESGTDEEVAGGELGGGPDDTHPNPERVALPPGDYDIEVEPRELEMAAREVSGVTVAGGEEVTKTLDFSTGTVVLEATRNGQPTPALYDIRDSETGDEVVEGELGGGPDDTHPNPQRIALPPGDYDVQVDPRELEQSPRWRRGVTVTADEAVNVGIDFARPSGGDADRPESSSDATSPRDGDSHANQSSSSGMKVSERSRFGDKYDLGRLGRQIQGTWVEFYGAGGGSRYVWQIHGDRFAQWGWDLEAGEVEKKTMDLELLAPCEVALVSENDYGRSASMQTVAMGSKKSYASTAVAVQTENGLFACTGRAYYQLDDSGCTRWKWDALDESWSSSSAQCERRENEVKLGDKTLKRVGDIYTAEPNERYRLKRFDNLDEARATLHQ